MKAKQITDQLQIKHRAKSKGIFKLKETQPFSALAKRGLREKRPNEYCSSDNFGGKFLTICVYSVCLCAYMNH